MHIPTTYKGCPVFVQVIGPDGQRNAWLGAWDVVGDHVALWLEQQYVEAATDVHVQETLQHEWLEGHIALAWAKQIVNDPTIEIINSLLEGCQSFYPQHTAKLMLEHCHTLSKWAYELGGYAHQKVVHLMHPGLSLDAYNAQLERDIEELGLS